VWGFSCVSAVLLVTAVYKQTVNKLDTANSLYLSYLVRIIISFAAEILVCLITRCLFVPRWGCWVI
jgi:hypothetical protein